MPPSVIGEVLAGRYKIVEHLGSGSFGTTYLATDTRRPGEPSCVVKQLRPIRNTPKSLKAAHRRFIREAQILEKLGKHDQIPQLLAYFQGEQEFYLVEEFIPGYALSKEFVPEEPLSEDRTIRLLQEILEILVFVHGQRVIHRDVKPANLIRRQPDGKLVLIDFGSVKELSGSSIGPERTRTIATGTPAYMPMEQFQGHPQYNSDIYALGIMGLQALTGSKVGDLRYLKGASGSQSSELLWEQGIQVGEDLAKLLDKMVCDDYRMRYQAAAEVLEDLQKIQSGAGLDEDEEVPPTMLQVPTKQDSETQEEEESGEPVAESAEIVPEPKSKSIQTIVGVGVGAIVAIAGLILFFHSQTEIKAKEFYTRGVEKLEKGDRKAALEDFNLAIRLVPDYDGAYYSRGKIHFDLGEYAMAIADYNRAIELNPEDAGAYANRCVAYLHLSKFYDAMDDCTRAIAINTDYGYAYANRCWARLQIGEHALAISDCTRALKLNPKDASAYYRRGLAYAATEDLKQAIADYGSAIRLNPNDAGAYNHRALARAELGDKQGAIADFEKAAQICRSDVAACFIDPQNNPQLRTED